MLAGRHLGQAGLLAPGLNLQEGDQGAHLLLHGREPDQRVQLPLELAEPAHLLGAAQSLEMLGHPVDGGLRGGVPPQLVADRAQDVEGAGHREQVCPTGDG